MEPGINTSHGIPPACRQEEAACLIRDFSANQWPKCSLPCLGTSCGFVTLFRELWDCKDSKHRIPAVLLFVSTEIFACKLIYIARRGQIKGMHKKWCHFLCLSCNASSIQWHRNREMTYIKAWQGLQPSTEESTVMPLLFWQHVSP